MFKIFWLFIVIVFVCCESDNLNNEGDWILLTLRPLKSTGSYNCKNLCENIVCETTKECTNGVVLKNESYCNCCDICVKYLDVGQSCKTVIGGSLALGGQSRCKPGTVCKNGKCELDHNIDSCLLQRQIRLEHKGKGKYSEDIWIPQCDEEGKYKGKQKKIRKSICVDESGQRIFGNPDYSLENTCPCSRHMQKKKEKDIAYNVKPQEHCSSSGNFDTLQCISNLCYCADAKSGQVKSDLVRIDFLEKLPCYDNKYHKKSYLKNCEAELQRSRKLAYEFEKKGVKLIGIDRVKCDPDGSYLPVQCIPDRCICTDKEGVGIGSYQKERRDIMNLNMTCNCARDEISAQLTSTFACLDYGNYNNFTCFDNDCVCVDEDGDSVSKELKKSDTDVSLLCNELIEDLLKEPSDEDYDDSSYEYSIYTLD